MAWQTGRWRNVGFWSSGTLWRALVVVAIAACLFTPGQGVKLQDDKNMVSIYCNVTSKCIPCKRRNAAHCQESGFEQARGTGQDMNASQSGWCMPGRTFLDRYAANSPLHVFRAGPSLRRGQVGSSVQRDCHATAPGHDHPHVSGEPGHQDGQILRPLCQPGHLPFSGGAAHGSGRVRRGDELEKGSLVTWHGPQSWCSTRDFLARSSRCASLLLRRAWFQSAWRPFILRGLSLMRAQLSFCYWQGAFQGRADAPAISLSANVGGHGHWHGSTKPRGQQRKEAERFCTGASLLQQGRQACIT